MHSIREFRSDPGTFKSALARRGERCDLDRLIELDEKKRSLTVELDGLRKQRNQVSKDIGILKSKKQDTSTLESAMRQISGRIRNGENDERRCALELTEHLLQLPNLPAASVPDGAGRDQNVIISTWGQRPQFDIEPKDHLELAERLGILDFKRGGKVAGAGFPVWCGAGALLERALINFMLDLHTNHHGYREMMAPFVASRESMLGSGQIPRLADDMYHCELDDLFLVPTSEVTLINLHRDEIITESALPLKYASYSPCFRREAGAYGKATRGFQRVHQFNKVELVRFEKPDESERALRELMQHAEAVLQRLELHYRWAQLCAGDLGFNAAECFDLEVWAPAEGGRWLEVSSCSNCRDFQARRASIRYRPQGGGRTEYVHTLNGSGLATSRLMVALLETNQTEEGSIAVPEALRPYMHGMTVITART